MITDDERRLWVTRSANLGELTTDAWWDAFTQPPGMQRLWGDHWEFTKAHLVYLHHIPYDCDTYSDLDFVQWLSQNSPTTNYSIVIEYGVGPNGGRRRISHMNNIRGINPRIAGIFVDDDTTLMLFKLAFGELINHDG